MISILIFYSFEGSTEKNICIFPFLTSSTLFQKHEFTVEMTCEGCSGAAKRVLGKLGGMSTLLKGLHFIKETYKVQETKIRSIVTVILF